MLLYFYYFILLNVFTRLFFERIRCNGKLFQELWKCMRKFWEESGWCNILLILFSTSEEDISSESSIRSSLFIDRYNALKLRLCFNIFKSARESVWRRIHNPLKDFWFKPALVAVGIGLFVDVCLVLSDFLIRYILFCCTVCNIIDHLVFCYP